jgi:hypothetical protein
MLYICSFSLLLVTDGCSNASAKILLRKFSVCRYLLHAAYYSTCWAASAEHAFDKAGSGKKDVL